MIYANSFLPDEKPKSAPSTIPSEPKKEPAPMVVGPILRVKNGAPASDARANLQVFLETQAAGDQINAGKMYSDDLITYLSGTESFREVKTNAAEFGSLNGLMRVRRNSDGQVLWIESSSIEQ